MIYGIDNGVLCRNVLDIEKFIKSVNPNHIYLDVDGVIFHSCQAICDILNGLYDTNVKGSDILSWNFKEFDEEFMDEDIEELFENKRFFEIVKWIDGAFEFIRKHENKIIIITKGTNDNIYYKSAMFRTLGLNIPVISLPFECSKGAIDMSGGLLIDDCTHNLKESNATYKIQFLEYKDDKNNIREWTKDWKGLKMYRWTNE